MAEASGTRFAVLERPQVALDWDRQDSGEVETSSWSPDRPAARPSLPSWSFCLSIESVSRRRCCP